MLRRAFDAQHEVDASEVPLEPQLTARLREIAAPALVVVGREDAVQVLEISRRIARDVPRAELVELDGLAHLPSLEAPEVVGPARARLPHPRLARAAGGARRSGQHAAPRAQGGGVSRRSWRLCILSVGAARRVWRCVLLVLCAAAAVAPPASAASTCASQQLAVQPLQSGTFYIDSATDYLGSYVGYRVTNSAGAGRDGLWQRLEAFSGGVVGPASGGSVTAPLPLDPVAAGGSTTGYAYLRAPSPTTAVQLHDVVLYDGRPGAGGVEVCRETQTISTVQEVIKAAANKVDGASLSTASATLGGTFELTVTGSSGQIGAGIDTDPGVVRFSPAVAGDWPSSAFRLTGVSHRLPITAAPVADVLSRSGMSGPDRQYAVTYSFRVVGTTSGPTPVVPVQNIASGTQVKHTDPGSLGTLAPIPKVTSNATMSVRADVRGPITSGNVVPLQATLANAGSGAITVDEVILQLPPTWTATAGSATRDGAPLDDPYDAGGGKLHLVGPFTVPAGGATRLQLDAVAGAPGSSGAFTAVASLPGGQIDATTDPSDTAPASVTLGVVGAPDAVDDALFAAKDRLTRLDVLANDDTGNAVPDLAIVTPPAHGTADVVGTQVAYEPDPGYVGADTFVYRLTTSTGSDDATVKLTVAAPPPLSPPSAPGPAPPAAAPPAPAPRDSAGVGTAPQRQTVAVPDGGSVRLLDAEGRPSTSVTVTGQGTYELDPATGEIAFTPVLGFTGAAEPVVFRVTDASGAHGDASYAPTVLPPAGPVPAPRSSTGVGAAEQGASLPKPAGGMVRLLDGSTPATSLDVRGEGTYSVDTASGWVRFVPAKGFWGAATPVTYRVTDAYGQHATASYTPAVTRPAAPPAGPETSTGVGTAGQAVALPCPTAGRCACCRADRPSRRSPSPARARTRWIRPPGACRSSPCSASRDARRRWPTGWSTPTARRPPPPTPPR
jgi:CshA-type fibril repeat protein